MRKVIHHIALLLEIIILYHMYILIDSILTLKVVKSFIKFHIHVPIPIIFSVSECQFKIVNSDILTVLFWCTKILRAYVWQAKAKAKIGK